MSRYRVVIGKRAEAEIDKIDAWWVAHRRDAPDLFLDELNAALRQIAEIPGLGREYRVRRPKDVRRVLLKGSHHHVYYTVDEQLAQVRVRAVWHAARGTLPRLD